MYVCGCICVGGGWVAVCGCMGFVSWYVGGYLCVGALWPAGVSLVGMFVGVEGCV